MRVDQPQHPTLLTHTPGSVGLRGAGVGVDEGRVGESR